MYKYANGLETLFYKVDLDNTINNYEQVSSFFTDEYISNAKKGSMCWPTEKNGLYYLNLDCSSGGPITYTYKEINIKEYSETKILFNITIDETHTSLTSDDKYERKSNNLEQEFEIVLQNNMWKINRFKYNGQPVIF